MTKAQNKCPKCDGDMVRGFILDYANGAIVVPNWYEGVPKKSFWIGTSEPTTEGIPVVAFRCSSCGFVEFYSHKKHKAK